MRIHFFVLFSVLIASLFAMGGCKGEPKPGQDAFNQANAKITVFQQEVGFGNTAECTTLAKRFSKRLKADENDTFEGGKDQNTMTTGGHFLTYCQETPSEIVVMVRVPNLETYSGEDRTVLVQLA